jgi:hypothetical protein
LKVAGDNYIIFSTPVLFDDKVKIKGRELHFDPMFQPWLHVRKYGTVTQLPYRLTAIPIMQENAGIPPYYDYSPYEYRYLSDISMEVQIGDKIYFHHNTIIRLQQNLVYEEKVANAEKGVFEPRYFLKVRYDQVICAVRNGEIIPIGSYVLVEPDWESLDDILRPTYELTGLLDDQGQPMKRLKPKDQWLQIKPAPNYHSLTGFVRHIGSPFIGDKCENQVGQKIVYRRNADWMMEIEGEKYFAIRQRHILGGF